MTEVLHVLPSTRKFGKKRYRYHTASNDRDSLVLIGKSMKNRNQIKYYRTVPYMDNGKKYYALYIY